MREMFEKREEKGKEEVAKDRESERSPTFFYFR
jgi:hypothetical protein